MRVDDRPHAKSTKAKARFRRRNKQAFSLAIHKSTLATTRSPGSPEGRRTREQPSYASRAWNGRPEWITPRHFGRTGTPRGGRRHAASIWAWRGTPAKHGAARWRRPPEHRCSCWRCRRGCRDAARPAAGPPPCRHPDACSTTEKSRHLYRTQPALRRRDAECTVRNPDARNFPNFFPDL